MKVPSDLDALLIARPIVLWVEDWLTKEYLARIWQPQDALFQVLVAGGHDSVRAVVRNLRIQDYRRVFGFRDRDFGRSNRSNWSRQTDIEVYVGSRLEIENYLLDWAALAGCTINQKFQRSVDQVKQRAESCAGSMIWWMACRQVIAGYHERLFADFPDHPSMGNVNTQADAERYIQEQSWFQSFSAHSQHILDPGSLAADLGSAHADQEDFHQSGKWIEEFSGKEIFRHLRGYLVNEDDGEADVNLAKSVADWQVQNNSVPQELLELRDALRRRVCI